MSRLNALLTVVLVALLLVPAQSLAAPTVPPAGPATTPTTFNVTRLGLYPPPSTGDYDMVKAGAYGAILLNNSYNWEYPPSSQYEVDLYDVRDPQNPQPVGQVTTDSGKTVAGMDFDGYALALAITFQSAYSISGGMAVVDANGSVDCSYDFPYGAAGMSYSVALAGQIVYVGTGAGLARMMIPGGSGQCTLTVPQWTSSPVYTILRAGTYLYLGQSDGVRMVNVTSWPPDEVAFYPLPHPVSNIAISPANYIYAATDYGLYIIDAASGQVTQYGPATSTVKVAVDGPKLYLGTPDDLRVLDMTDPRAPQLIGDYVDSHMDFERSLAFYNGLVHTPKGIFMWRPELLLEAQGAGVTLNGTAVASGSTVVVKAGDHVRQSAAAGTSKLKTRCTENLDDIAAFVASRDPALIGIGIMMGDPYPFLVGMCSSGGPKRFQAVPGALPLRLEDGAITLQMLATTGTVEVDTPFASSWASAGTFDVSYDPGNLSRFVCRAGALSLQPTAAGAPLISLHPVQYVEVTAAGAGPVRDFRFGYLPALLR